MLFYPLGDLGQMLVFLPDIVLLTEVDEVNDRLGCKEKERVYDFDLSVPLD